MEKKSIAIKDKMKTKVDNAFEVFEKNDPDVTLWMLLKVLLLELLKKSI
jgi:hypothetical protein